LFTLLPDAESDTDDDGGTSRDCSAVVPKHSITACKNSVNEQQLASFANKG